LKPVLEHSWELTAKEALVLQRKLSTRVRADGPAPRDPFLVAACDAIVAGKEIIACIVVLRFPGWERIDAAWARGLAPLPYVPGLLSFREGPLYLAAFARLRVSPDLLLCDGQGIAHPRGFGLASHLGVLFDLSSIGVAKSRLAGRHREPGWARGSSRRLVLSGRVVGRVVRTQTGVKPLYVSPGHRIGIAEAAELVVRLSPRYRLPEPSRAADQWVRRLRRGGE
jgi:deoxyribonuclease V